MKKKGSAIILTVLLLGFFTAMSLNIYYIGQKKSETAGDKKAGEQLTNDIDIASSIIYQEAYLAENFVRTGVLYDLDKYGTDLSGFDDYELKNGDNSYFDVSDGTYDKEYPGIQLSSISEYFDSNWNYKLDNDGNETGAASQKLIMSEVVEDGEAESRIWQSGGVPSKITKLWEDTSLLSIGGYKLKSIEIDGVDVSVGTNTKTEIENELDTDSTYIKASFEKTVEIEGNGDIPSMKFVITATETVNLDTTSGTTLADVDFYGAVMNLTIEKQ
ncbi:hypothetical protein [Ilyobacter polytropus]|uniref:Uncharacterized protein n=1 Tax=Ilyobacter polytropus (strain ATCC 51220 / DSM 2926 / LMG 16218 / CuHBu1) TaxID=572544 RepID=E3H6Y5_ILYPC|nr:hypothetical protein [Ilyobacter polytropus]ADO82504.1 hypothetical protein Ilyop_0717 [Ilyobacter polytropus DSM 2926]